MSPEAPTQAPPRRREMAQWLVGLLVVSAGLVGTVVAMGGRVEAATWGLVVAAGAMVFALHALYRMTMVLSRPAVEVVIEQNDVAAMAGVRELREERRRVLRAINELQFDYEMGKLSDDDFQKVRQGYQLRAVEVMRALDSEASLHPALEEALQRRGLLQAAEPPEEGRPPAAAAAASASGDAPGEQAPSESVDASPDDARAQGAAEVEENER